MGLLVVYLFDTRNLSPENKSEVYEYIDRIAFMSPSLIPADDQIVGCIAYFERDPFEYLAKMPHKCPYKDVSNWDLSDAKGAFGAAFMNQFL